MPTKHPILSMPQHARDRFYAKIRQGGPDECHEWQAAFSTGGYGLFRAFSYDSMIHAHRVAYALHHNIELPEPDRKAKTMVLHHCHNRKCCNPLHLYLGSHQDNMDDMNRAGRGVFIGKPPKLYGTRNAHNKLSEAQVIEIRSIIAANNVPKGWAGHPKLRVALATQYGVDPSTISDIFHRTWKHLNDQELSPLAM